MYTRCPHCRTLFVVGAAQLKAAHGNVRCGTCLESFDAIPYLSDGPEEPAGTAAARQAPSAAPSASSVASPDPLSDGRSAGAQLSSTLSALGAAHSIPEAADAAAEGEEGEQGDEGAEVDEFDQGVEGDEGEDAAAQATPSDAAEDAFDAAPAGAAAQPPHGDFDDELPEILREQSEQQSARSAARRRNVGYGVAAAALLAVLAFQYLFFMPEDAARRYPQWRNAIESMCVRIGCVLPERRDPSRIRVLSRDVRLHPKYEGVLQIKATLSNSAPFRQPYPRLRFTLFNVNGQTIATRVFQPSEYLGRSVSPNARLRPRTSFQIALDVLAPEEAAVSFEFQFL